MKIKYEFIIIPELFRVTQTTHKDVKNSTMD